MIPSSNGKLSMVIAAKFRVWSDSTNHISPSPISYSSDDSLETLLGFRVSGRASYFFSM
jgi:hypothetical protein